MQLNTIASGHKFANDGEYQKHRNKFEKRCCNKKGRAAAKKALRNF